MAKPMAVTDETFHTEVLGSTTPVLVDFWAEWCGPCHMVAPIVEEIANEQSGKLKVAKLDIDENPEVATRFNVMSIPTLLVFKGGQPVARIVGYQPKHQLMRSIEPHL